MMYMLKLINYNQIVIILHNIFVLIVALSKYMQPYLVEYIEKDQNIDFNTKCVLKWLWPFYHLGKKHY